MLVKSKNSLERVIYRWNSSLSSIQRLKEFMGKLFIAKWRCKISIVININDKEPVL